MKIKYTITFILLVLMQFNCSNGPEIKIETKKLITNRSIYLNGGLNANFGGKSRTVLKIDLPPNTVEWYYSFSTTKGESGTQNLNLAIQLAALMADSSGLSSGILSSIKVPEGIASADIYLLDKSNMAKFIAKEDLDLHGEQISYAMEGTAESTKQALVRINDITSGTVYLGLKNPSTLNGITLNIEVVAITGSTIEPILVKTP
ncbi:MAG TPA: hypothetical protein DEA82_13325 [Flavobacteriaceae bacterium]|nr:hypothetical protein [Flavobacteriaceae bacterium]